MAGGRFKVEYVDALDAEPLWFDDQGEMDAMTDFITSCPVDDNPPGVGNKVRLKITEFGINKITYK